MTGIIKELFYMPLSLGRRRRMLLCALMIALIAVIGVGMTRYAEDRLQDNMVRESSDAMHDLSLYLTREFRDVERSVELLAGLPWVVETLSSSSPDRINQTNRQLYDFNRTMGTSVCYLLNREGMAIAASNYLDERSMVGHDYGFRMYFTQAMRGVPAHSYLMGVTTLTKGYYVSSPVKDSYEHIIGVVVVKHDLDPMEGFFQNYPISFYINPLGIIILSSDSRYSLKSLWPIDAKVQEEILASKLFGDKPFQPLFSSEVTSGMELDFQGEPYLASREYIGQEGMSIVHLTRTHSHAIRSTGYTMTTGMVVFLSLLTAGIFTITNAKEKVARGPRPDSFF